MLLIYPEGTRVNNNERGETHGGFALIAQFAKVDVQLLEAIIGALDIKKKALLAAS